MPKARHSKLTPFAEQLMAMDAERKTLSDMAAWLGAQGVQVSAAAISMFLANERRAALQDKLLAQIAAGARQCREVEQQFRSNPAPEMETLIKLHRVAVMQLSTQAQADPDLLRLVDQLSRTAMDYAAGQAKHALEKQRLDLQVRRVELLEKRAAQADATDQVLAQDALTPEEREARIKEIYGR